MKNNEDYRRAIELKAEKIIQKRKRFIASAASAVACFSLIICAVVLMPDLINKNPLPKNHGRAHENMTNKSNKQSGHNMTTPTPYSVPVVNMNTISESMGSDRLYFDPKKTYEETWNWKQITKYLGKDITPAYITDGLKINPKIAEQTVIFNNDGTMAYDQIWLEYYTEYYDDGSQSIGGDSTGIRIIASKTGYPQDCIYVWPSDMKETLLNDVSIKFGYRKMGWGGTAEKPEHYYDLYIAEFIKDNISFQVESSNIKEQEFIKMVDSLTQK